VKAQFVLDASALLSMVLDERGHERVPGGADPVTGNQKNISRG